MIDNYDPSNDTLNLLVWQALKQWDTEVLFTLLKEKNALIRTAAARELQIRGGESVFKETINLISSNSEVLREMAAFILGQLGTPLYPYKYESLPILLSLVTDSNADVRAATAAALGHLGYETLLDDVESALMTLCSDESSDVRACAAFALGKSSGRQEIKDLLTAMLSQESVGDYADLGLELLEDKEKIREEGEILVQI
ncbi:HEAT repeat domain-containing protein [Thiolinea disciformis]|uniref:HEAT repeat domain-containing protein n=1 Tax=Thiolinea disciformis TaxID=125614 RepID=UPI000373A08D|nr:HEAT repeat domain-containing protein [Thiolinea disciformis]